MWALQAILGIFSKRWSCLLRHGSMRAPMAAELSPDAVDRSSSIRRAGGLDVDVDAVEQGAAYPCPVALDLGDGAAALPG